MDSADSDDVPLNSVQKGTIIPSKFKFQVGDKTTIIDQICRNLARKTIRRINPATRGTLKPVWSIVLDGTIIDYAPHILTIDTNSRRNTAIRNNAIAISADTRPKPSEPKFRLKYFVAC